MHLEKGHWGTYLQGWNRDEDVRTGVWTQRGRERVEWNERAALTWIEDRVYSRWWGPLYHTRSSAQHSVMTEGAGRMQMEGISVYLQLMHAVVQKKLTQHWKAIILLLHLKKNFFNLNKEYSKKKKRIFLAGGKYWICENIHCSPSLACLFSSFYLYIPVSYFTLFNKKKRTTWKSLHTLFNWRI